MVDIDTATFQIPAEIIGQDLHIPGKHNQVGACFLDQVAQILFSLCFCILGHGDVVKRQIMAISMPFRIGMEIAIKLGEGADTPVPVLSGLVMGIETIIAGSVQYVVIIRDKMEKLRFGTKTRTFKEQSIAARYLITTPQRRVESVCAHNAICFNP